MLSKNEDFKPPEEHEEWINGEFTNVLDYLSENKVRFDGTVFIHWVAAPFISIWVARSTAKQGDSIWIMHNMDFTDHIISSSLEASKDIILAFAEKWESSDLESLRCRHGNKDKLENTKKMLFNVGRDESLWV